MMPFFSRRRREADLDEEIRTHLRLAVDERMARGESRGEAERAARREFGDVGRVKEVTRTMWGGVWLDRLAQDLRFGVRSLRRAPGFAVVAMLTLGLGVGVTTAMFTVVNGVLFRELPFFEPDRLMALSVRPVSRNDRSVLEHHFTRIRRESSSFAGLATYSNYPPTTLTGAGDPARLNAGFVTAEFFEVLGVPPAWGPGFLPGDDQADAPAVVVLGDALWRSRFGADANIVGTTAMLDGISRTIVGVMPPGFDFPQRADLWLPLEVHDGENGAFSYPVVARLKEGVTIERATDELSALAADFGPQGPRQVDLRAKVIPLKHLLVGDSERPLLIFMGAVALVLLISCTNVANLLLMRAVTREREMGLRKVLGAGKVRLVRQLLTESVMVALLGGAIGVFVAVLGVQALLALAPPGTIPRGSEVHVDLMALAFALGISGVTGIVFGLAPALKAIRPELRDSIAEGARMSSPARGRARGALVVAEVGLAVVLLAGAGLLLRSFQQIRAIDLGFRAENTLTFYVDLPDYSYAGPGPRAAMHRRVLDGLREIPGVEAAGAGNSEPFGPITYTTSISGLDGAGDRMAATYSIVSPGYFRAMGMRLRAGRAFSAQDDVSAPRVVVVAASVAARLWPNRDPIGRLLSRRGSDAWTVVGVVEDVVQNHVTDDMGATVYVPVEQIGTNNTSLGHMRYVVRTEAGSRTVAPAMRAALKKADPNLPSGSISTMDDLVLATEGDRVFQTRILTVFAFLALLLAAVGVYGVTAYSVSERTHEIGVRVALGARPEQVVRMTLGRVSSLVVPGLLLGSVAGLAASRLIAASLFEVAPTDPLTFIAVALLLGGVSVAAALVPTIRAAKVDPLAALRLQ